jgi:hypothetical protein
MFQLVSLLVQANTSCAHLSCSIYDLCRVSLTFVYDLVAEAVLDRRIIAFHEVALAILNCQG